jgi:hypothetical protein
MRALATLPLGSRMREAIRTRRMHLIRGAQPRSLQADAAAQLPPRAHQIYVDLITAIEHARGC